MRRDRGVSGQVMTGIKAYCETCGGELSHRHSEPVREADSARARSPDLDDLGAAVWVQAYDAAWLGQDWPALERRLAPDVVWVEQGFTGEVQGRAAVVSRLREIMLNSRVHEYNKTDISCHTSAGVVVITYRWQLDLTVGNARRARTGRDVLVLSSGAIDWQLAWRGQITP